MINDTDAVFTNLQNSNVFSQMKFDPSLISGAKLDPEFMEILRKKMMNATVDNLRLMSDESMHSMEMKNTVSSLSTRIGILDSLQRSLG